ncbi:MAG: NAD(P)/FAD-dependent oxidoreductase, partial [Firmicutes bacterium]|nr:NAD(P)/FAD-dependent oxidoreductase [Bacillota bacterium]
YRATGSSGDGYALAAMVGHTIIEPLPALVPLVAAESWVGELAGLSLRNVEFSLYRNGQPSKKNLLVKLFGELLFTHFGLSGPVVLTASRPAALFWRDNPGQPLLL